MRELVDSLPLLAKVGAGGVLSLVAVYLVWTLATGVATAAQVLSIGEKFDRHEQSTMSQEKLLRLICVSVAESEQVRVECQR